MKNILLNIVILIVTITIHSGITALYDFDYNLFRDGFDLIMLLKDLGLFLVIFVPIYIITRKLFLKK
ncbi:hypothetical protein [Ornithinibacillus halophilus]|uniref:Uncharacterized protein n=1 Tax=Ornithinibacillus halophilus TaxID=930117 RepID=A0A1M5J7V4_9BACI|nr:hypothetical protein [Ornithinibacillus halophilus]SHG36389.1 hypothetical protein SAMN05216225_102837 [Ornithinibacillus halophilus]